MKFKVLFRNTITDINGNKKILSGREEKREFTTRKTLFDFIDHINENQSLFKYQLLPGEKIECSDIVILEPKIENIKSKNGQSFKKIIGYESYPVDQYRKKYCRICGRSLTDPISIRRGIGPECYLKFK